MCVLLAAQATPRPRAIGVRQCGTARDRRPASGPAFAVTLHHGELDRPQHWRRPRRIFVCSMGDLLHEQVPPYAGPWRLEPGKGYRHDDAEHLWPRLVEVLSGVKHAAVILSGYPCQAAEDLGWTRLGLAHKRSVPARSASTLVAAPEASVDQPRRRGLATEPVRITQATGAAAPTRG